MNRNSIGLGHVGWSENDRQETNEKQVKGKHMTDTNLYFTFVDIFSPFLWLRAHQGYNQYTADTVNFSLILRTNDR